MTSRLDHQSSKTKEKKEEEGLSFFFCEIAHVMAPFTVDPTSKAMWKTITVVGRNAKVDLCLSP